MYVGTWLILVPSENTFLINQYLFINLSLFQIAVKLIGLVRFIEAMVFIAFPTSIANILETLVSVKRIEVSAELFC